MRRKKRMAMILSANCKRSVKPLTTDGTNGTAPEVGHLPAPAKSMNSQLFTAFYPCLTHELNPLTMVSEAVEWQLQ
jgi:hypothetical protein